MTALNSPRMRTRVIISLLFTSEVFGIEVVALIFGGQVRRDPQGPRQGEEPRAGGAEGQARWVRRQGDAWSVVRQVLELLLLWPQGGAGEGTTGRRRYTAPPKKAEGTSQKSSIQGNC